MENEQSVTTDSGEEILVSELLGVIIDEGEVRAKTEELSKGGGSYDATPNSSSKMKNRPWEDADSLEEAVEALAEQARKADDFPEDNWYANQLEKILEEHQ